jgi:signal transduction histidine kinase/CheY-like chemotaxis protein
MRKVSLASASRVLRAIPGVAEDDRLLLEEATLRRALLELRPDTAHSREPAREANRARFSEALAVLGELAIESEEIEALLAIGCELILETLDVDAVALLQEVPATGRLSVRSAAGCLAQARGEVVDAGDGTQAGFALANRGATATADARAAWMDDRFLASHGLVAAALAPLPGFASPRLVLGAYALHRRAFAPDEIRFLEATGGSLSAAVARCRSDAERKELHAKLALADRMVSVGTLAAGVAHELNNPLAYVTANVTFLAEQVAHLSTLLPPDACADAGVADVLQQLDEAARDAKDGVDRMRVIVRDLKMLSRADDASVGPVDLGPVLDSCVNVAWNELKHRARVVKDVHHLPAVRGSAGRLGQIFLNLLVNAAQAMPEGRPELQEIRVTARPLGADRVVIEVSDTGCGIPPENLPRIFDPFFTTKAPGVGTGLGLSIVQGIVTAMQGEIGVESTVGRGSTFRVTLPVGLPDPADEHPAGPPADTAPASGRARLLVVDDEPLVGTVLSRTLGGEHAVVVCGSGREALDRLARGEAFDLVFSDLLMPGMTGMELHAELSRSHPDLARRMVFLTGGACTEAARDFLEQPGMECVEKPFDLESIRQVIARRLPPRG